MIGVMIAPIDDIKKRIPWEEIKKVAIQNGIEPELLGAIVLTESSGDQWACRFEPHYKWLFQVRENAVRNKITEDTEKVLQMCSYGLCQVMGAVARELGMKGPMFELLSVGSNLSYACRLITRLRAKYKTNEDVLAAYNAGSVIKLQNSEYKNQVYVNKSMSWYRNLKQIGGEKWKR